MNLPIDHPDHPDYKTFDERAAIAIEKRLQAEREWMEFIVAVGVGRIRETTHDRYLRVNKEIAEERRKKAEAAMNPPTTKDGE